MTMLIVLLGLAGDHHRPPSGSAMRMYGCSALVAPIVMTKRQSKRLRKKSSIVPILAGDVVPKKEVGSTPPEPPDLTSEIRALVKSSSLSSSASRPQMPHWLANYDDILFEDSEDGVGVGVGIGNKYSLGLLTSRMGDEPSKVARTNVSRLKAALDRHHTYLGCRESECFSQEDINDVMDALRVASGGDYALLAGAAEFLWLLLSVEENQFTGKGKELAATTELKPQTLFDDDEDDYDTTVLIEEDISANRKEQKRPFNIFTRDTLIASAFHYADCVEARRSGVYGMVSQAVRGMNPTSSFADSWKRQLLPAPPSRATRKDERETENDEASNDIELTGATTPSSLLTSDELITQFGEDAARIAQATARIKRAELLADTVAFASATDPERLGDGRTLRVRGPTPSLDEADTLRSLLISVSEDWRGLAIRSVACLYRLRGIVQFGGGDRTPEVAKAAREAVRVYAPIAGRLGMHRLKANLEELAFGILYQRQYAAAAVLYDQNGDVMHDIEAFATSSVEELLSADDMLMSQVDSLKVSSRVKQPYSLWKKLLKRRTQGTVNGGGRRKELSVQNLGDAVALRVVLRAKRLSPAETDGTIATREAILCYYVHTKIMQKFPARDESMIKDYISSPKPNGYQSLHHTANLFRNGVDWLFEVQVRSEEMHRLAEFGVAAHWDYKIQGPLVPVTTVAPSADVVSRDSDSSQEEIFKAGDGADEGIEEFIDGVLDANLAEEEDAEDDENDAERSDRCYSYIEALTSAREDIKANNVFVFISSTASANDGKILPLSLGATVADALRKAEDRYGMNLVESKLLCNGQDISMGDELKNGDVVVIASQ